MQQLTNEFEAQCSTLTAESSKYMRGAITSLVADVSVQLFYLLHKSINVDPMLLWQIMEVACGKFNSIENCSKEAPQTMKTLRVLTARNVDSQQASSMLRPLIKIAVSLDETS